MLMDKETQIKSLKENKEALEGKVKFLQETCRRAGAQIKKLEAELKEINDSELWQAGAEVRKLRPENAKAGVEA